MKSYGNQLVLIAMVFRDIYYLCSMKVLLDIKDQKANFVLELLRNLSFVKAKRLSDSKGQLMEEITEAVEELRLIRSGKKKARNADDFIREL